MEILSYVPGLMELTCQLIFRLNAIPSKSQERFLWLKAECSEIDKVTGTV